MWQPTHVKVTVKQARGILTKGKNGTNDAFVVIGIGKEKYQTSIKEKSSSSFVEWREECELAIPSQGNKASIQLTVYHHNTLGLDEFLGQVGLPLSDFDVYEKPKYRSYRLKGKPEKDKKKGEKERGELEVMVNFTVKSGSFLDISKKEKQKSSLTSLKHLGGSLMSLGGKDKREGLKNFAKSVSSKMDKIAKPKRRKSKTPSENSSAFPNDLMSSQQRYGDADPGVISDDDDDDFKFDDDVKVNTRTSSPLSTMSRGSSLMHDQVLDTDYEVGSYEDPDHDFSYSLGKTAARPPIIVDETKETVSGTPNLGRQAVTPQKVTSFSSPNPFVRMASNTPETVETIIEEELSFEKKEPSTSDYNQNGEPECKDDSDSDFDCDDNDYQKLGSIDLGPPIELPKRVLRKQDVSSPILITDETVDSKTKKGSESSGENYGEYDSPTYSTYLPTNEVSTINQNLKKEKIGESKQNFEIKNVNLSTNKVDTTNHNLGKENNKVLKPNFEMNNTNLPVNKIDTINQNLEEKAKELQPSTLNYIELETAKSDVIENNSNDFNKVDLTTDEKFEELYSDRSSPSIYKRDQPVDVRMKVQVTVDCKNDQVTLDSKSDQVTVETKNDWIDEKNMSQRSVMHDEIKPKILEENVNLKIESREGRDSAISLSHDPDSIISSRPRSSSNASSVLSSTSSNSVHVDSKGIKDSQLTQQKISFSEKESSKSLLKSSSDLDVLLRKKNSTGKRDTKRAVSVADCLSSGDLEENHIVRSGSLTERRPSAVAAAAVASSTERVNTTPGIPPTTIDEWERKLYGRSGITGSVENVSMTGSRSSLNTSRESSIHDIKKEDSFTRLPEVKALTLEKMSLNEGEDDGKKQKRKHKTGFKNRFFPKSDTRDRPNEDSRIVEGGNDRLPSIPSRPSKLPQEIHDKFAGKSREDLLEMILNLQSTLEKQVKHSSELEEYIDNLLLRVMEATPHILQAPITTGTSVKYDAKILGFF